MAEIVLEAKKREFTGKKVKNLREEGFIPAILYGRDIESIPIALEFGKTRRILSSVTSSDLVVVDINGEKHNTLVRDRQIHAVTGVLLHIDFQEVSLTEKIKTLVTIELQGESPAVRELNGVVVTGQEALEVECLPQDLPSRFIVDISDLEEIGNAVYVRDIIVEPAVSVLTDTDEMVVLITVPSKVEEEEIEEVEEEILEGLEEPEVIEKGKKEGEEEEEED